MIASAMPAQSRNGASAVKVVGRLAEPE